VFAIKRFEYAKGELFFNMAFMIVSGFLIQGTRSTLGGLPAALRRSAKALRSGFNDWMGRAVSLPRWAGKGAPAGAGEGAVPVGAAANHIRADQLDEAPMI
jgi:hypothetical protein